MAADSPPTLLIHGTADGDVSVTNSEELAAAMMKNGVEHRLMRIEGMDHGYDGLDVELTDALDRAAADLLRLHLIRSDPTPLTRIAIDGRPAALTWESLSQTASPDVREGAWIRFESKGPVAISVAALGAATTGARLESIGNTENFEVSPDSASGMLPGPGPYRLSISRGEPDAAELFFFVERPGSDLCDIATAIDVTERGIRGDNASNSTEAIQSLLDELGGSPTAGSFTLPRASIARDRSRTVRTRPCISRPEPS